MQFSRMETHRASHLHFSVECAFRQFHFESERNVFILLSRVTTALRHRAIGLPLSYRTSTVPSSAIEKSKSSIWGLICCLNSVECVQLVPKQILHRRETKKQAIDHSSFRRRRSPKPFKSTRSINASFVRSQSVVHRIWSERRSRGYCPLSKKATERKLIEDE